MYTLHLKAYAETRIYVSQCIQRSYNINDKRIQRITREKKSQLLNVYKRSVLQ
jgi:hypothetical protein